MPSRIIRQSPGFSPRQLFATIQGAWYEPRLGSMWQENIGTTATTAAGQTIGLILDQSQQVQIGSTLLTNGDFSNGSTGWTLAGSVSVVGGIATFDGITSITAGVALLQQTVSLTSGRLYRIQYTITDNTSLQISTLVDGGGSSVANAARSAQGTYTDYSIAPINANRFNIVARTFNGARTGGVNNLLMQEIAGNHAIQATAANRPTYRLDANNLPLVRHDNNDVLTSNLPNLGSGVFSSAGSVYFATPQGMSGWHNQAMGTTYNLPALNTDWYSCIVLPARLPKAKESQLERYMLKLAGLIEPDYLLDDTYAQLLDDGNDYLLRA